MPDEKKTRVIVSPRFRYLGAGATDDLGDQLSGIVTTELVNSGHFVVVARQEAVEALTQTINRVASRDYIEAHPGATINISQNINTTLGDDELKELSVLHGEVRSHMIALGVDYVVYGKYYDVTNGELRIEIYGLAVEEAALQGAEPVQTLRLEVERAVQGAAARLAQRIRRVIEEQRKGRRLSLAVLPFQSLEPASKWSAWSSALTEELIAALQNARELQLFDRARTRKYRDADQDALDLAQLGRDLQVDLLLLGRFSVNEAKQQVRIFARLVSTDNEEILKTFKITGGMDEDTQAELARQILDKLNVQPAAVAEVKAVHTDNVSARDYVRIGLHYFDEGELDKALNSFRSAVKLDPQYVEAHYHLGLLQFRLKDYPAALQHFESALGGAGDLSFGQQIWKLDAGSRVWTRPILADGRVLVATEAGIVCSIEQTKGELQWRTDVYEPVTLTPARHPDALVIAAASRGIGITPQTGEVKWLVDFDAPASGNVALEGSTAFFTTQAEAEDSESEEPTACKLIAVDVADGSVRWEKEWINTLAPALAHDGRVIAAVADDAVRALAAESGDELWSARLEGQLGSSPITDGKRIYYVATGGYAAALDWQTGNEVWRLPCEGSPSEGRPCLHDGVLYAAVGERLHVIDAATGELQWSFNADFPIGALALGDGLIFLTSRVLSFGQKGEHVLIAIDSGTKPQRNAYWRRTFSDSLYGEITIDNGVLYLGSRNHMVYALNVARSHTGPIRAAEIWNQIGLVHGADGNTRAAINAFERAIELNPAHSLSYRNLVGLYVSTGRQASAINAQQGYLELVRGEAAEEEAQQRLNQLSGFRWKESTGGLLPLTLLPHLQPERDVVFSPITPAPIATAEAVYMAGADGTTQCFAAATGQEIWRFEHGEHNRSTATIAGDRLFVGSDSGVHALAAANGKELWSFPTQQRVDSTATVSDGVVFVGSEDGHLYALDAAEGKLRWPAFESGGPIKSRPAVDSGLVCFGSYDGCLYAISAADGQLVWKFQTEDILNSSPTVADGVVFIGADDGHVYALDLKSGEEVWRFRVEEQARSVLKHGITDPGGVTTFGFLPSTPAVAGDLVLAGSNGVAGSQLYALDRATGQRRWSFEVDSGEVASPVLWRHVVFFGAGGIIYHDRHIYAVDVRDGSLLWKFRTADDVLSAPAISGDSMYCWCLSGDVYAFDIAQIAAHKPDRDANFYLKRASVQADEKKYPAAIDSLLKARLEYPNDTRILIALADNYAETGNREEQRKALSEVQRLDHAWTASYWRLGLVYLDEGNYDAAIEQFRAYIRVQPEGTKSLGYILLGDARLAQGDTDGALAEWRTGIAKAAVFLPLRTGTEGDRETALTSLSQLFVKVAIQLFLRNESIEQEIDLTLLEDVEIEKRDVFAGYAFARGLIAEQAADYDTADTGYGIALVNKPDLTNQLLQVAMILSDQQHSFDRAYAVHRVILERSPDELAAQINAAEAALNSGSLNDVQKLTAGCIEGEDWSFKVLGHAFRVLASLAGAAAAQTQSDVAAFGIAVADSPLDHVVEWDFTGTQYALEHGALSPEARTWALQLIKNLAPHLDRAAIAALVAALPIQGISVGGP